MHGKLENLGSVLADRLLAGVGKAVNPGVGIIFLSTDWLNPLRYWTLALAVALRLLPLCIL